MKAAQEQATLERMEAAQADQQRARAAILAIMEDASQPAAIRLKAAQSILEAANALEARAEKIANANAEANDGLFGLIGRR